MAIERAFASGLIALALASPAGAEAPLSAIDWLSKSVMTPQVVAAPPAGDLPPVTEGGALPGDVSVSVLGGPSPDAVGLLPPSVTGLPQRLWGMGLTGDVVAALAMPDLESLPALQSLYLTLLLAEAQAPSDAALAPGQLLIARIDRLLALGALEQARSLIEAAGPASSAEVFRRAFDVALLTGGEDRACATMVQSPALAPTFPARIFCLARSGDVDAATLTLSTARALGQIGADEDQLMALFLDPELADGGDLPPAPVPVTPLVWRMFEAIGEPLPTTTLPLAFAHAELRDVSGWKAQIEAAERLARAGAISPNVLLGLYTDRKPAASGGVWDRAAAFQAFDTAMTRADPLAVGQTLPGAWNAMLRAELEVPFADLYGADLARLALRGEAARIAFEIGLLAPQYEAVARARVAEGQREAFLAGLAKGDLTGLTPPDSMGRAIAPAFAAPVLPEAAAALQDEGRIGELILMSLRLIAEGVHGDLGRVTQGLSLLRHLGLDDTARRCALELMLLERRG